MKFLYPLLLILVNVTIHYAKPDSNSSVPIKLNTEQDLQKYKSVVNQHLRSLSHIDKKQGKSLQSVFDIKDKLKTLLAGFFEETSSFLKCGACKVSVDAISFVARRNFLESLLIEALQEYCTSKEDQPKSVCRGVADSSGKSVYHILGLLDTESTNVKETTCFAIFNACKFPDLNLSPPALPKVDNSLKFDNGISKETPEKILHISDLHYDKSYKQGSEADCNKPICCQEDSASDMPAQSSPKRPAGRWGDYKCDANQDLLNSLLSNAKKTSNDGYEMVFFTGDVPAHDLWKESKEKSKKTEVEAYKMISNHFDPKRNKLYPVIGNHEPVPLNMFPGSDRVAKEQFDLYSFIADQWMNWLPKSAIDTVRKGGYYSVDHSKSLKVIVLNTNIYYILNFYALLYPKDSDPNGQFKFLINQLSDAESKKMKVYIAGHVPPGSADFYPHWSNSFSQIITRYSHLIAGQFYGHLHTDQFEIFYSDTSKSASSAINTAYLAPSMSTMDGINPSYRVYQADVNTKEITDYHQQYADLKESFKWTKDANWKKLYSARSLFPESSSQFPTLNGTYWHLLTEKMKTDAKKFDQVYEIRKAQGEKQPNCDAKCRSEYICTLQAGKSGDNCAPYVPFS